VPETEEVRAEGGELLAELPAVEETGVEETVRIPFVLDDEEAPAANERAMDASVPALDRETEQETGPQQVTEPEPKPGNPPPPLLIPEEVVDWSRWERATDSPRQAPQSRPAAEDPSFDPRNGRSGVRAVIDTIQAERSTLSQLRALRRELPQFEGASVATLSELVGIFPDGWVRRRAVCTLLEGGVVLALVDALELVSALERESDRRWCLGLLARRAELGGANLDRALELVSSPSSRRRLRTAARE
jgi:hypothetical protein